MIHSCIWKMVQNEICTNLNISILIQNISHLAMLLYSMYLWAWRELLFQIPYHPIVTSSQKWVVKRYKICNRATTEPRVKSTWINKIWKMERNSDSYTTFHISILIWVRKLHPFWNCVYYLGYYILSGLKNCFFQNCLHWRFSLYGFF